MHEQSFPITVFRSWVRVICLSLVPKDTVFLLPLQHFFTFFYIIRNTFEFSLRGALSDR